MKMSCITVHTDNAVFSPILWGKKVSYKFFLNGIHNSIMMNDDGRNNLYQKQGNPRPVSVVSGELRPCLPLIICDEQRLNQ